MFTIEQLEQKVKELAAQIEQSAAQHHILLGSKLTWEAMLAEAKKIAEDAKSASAVLDMAASGVDEVVQAIEGSTESAN